MNNLNIRPAAESANYSPSAYREALGKIGVVVSFTKGVSMRPLIWTGRHYVAIVAVDEPQVGDMLLFEQMRRGETACILHRLVGVERPAPEAQATVAVGNARKSHVERDAIYITRGDNCLGVERIRREDIIGRVEVVYRASGWRPWFVLWGKEIHVTDKSYLRYVKLWNRTWPVRKQAFRFRAWFYSNPFSQTVLRPVYRFLKYKMGKH